MLDSAIASARLVLCGDLHGSSSIGRLSWDEAAAESGDRGGWWGRLSLSACCRACLTWGQPAERRGYSAATFFLGVTGVSFLEELQLAHLCNERVWVWAVCDVLTRNLKHWGGLGSMSLNRSTRCLPESFVQPPLPFPSPSPPNLKLFSHGIHIEICSLKTAHSQGTLTRIYWTLEFLRGLNISTPLFHTFLFSGDTIVQPYGEPSVYYYQSLTVC